MPQTHQQRIDSAIKKVTALAAEHLFTSDANRHRTFALAAEPLMKRFNKTERTQIINEATRQAVQARSAEELFEARMFREADKAIAAFETEYEPQTIVNASRRRVLKKRILNDRELVKKLK